MSFDSFKWLLVRWQNGGCDVVDIASVVRSPDKEPRLGDVIKVRRGEQREMGTLIGRAEIREMLEAGPSWRCEPRPSRKHEARPSRSRRHDAGPTSSQEAGPTSSQEAGPTSGQAAGPGIKNGEEGDDYSCSGSSWVPSDDSDTEATPIKMSSQSRIITRSQRNSSKSSFLRNLNLTRMREIGKKLSDSTKRQNGEKYEIDPEIEANMNQAKELYDQTLGYFEDFMGHFAKKQTSREQEHGNLDLLLKAAEEINRTEQSVQEDVKECGEENRKTEEQKDNILITKKSNVAETNELVENEWVPIGSGKTLVHRDKFKTVNWRSYTIATRTLLVALFPRSILATHSLTGKSSPAFKDKPLKMGLDSQIISDVIMEIVDRFNVGENLVRSVITTKCADECKMMKMRTNNKKPKNDENMPPDTNNNSDKENENP